MASPHHPPAVWGPKGERKGLWAVGRGQGPPLTRAGPPWTCPPQWPSLAGGAGARLTGVEEGGDPGGGHRLPGLSAGTHHPPLSAA